MSSIQSLFDSLESLLNQVSTMAVVSLLNSAWVAAPLLIFAASIPSSKVNALRKFIVQMSGRGKIMDSSARKLSVPQRYFCHFYIIGVIWTTFMLVTTWMYAYKTAAIVSDSFRLTSHLTAEFSSHKSHSSTREYKYGIWTCVFLLFLMEAQVLRRLIESIYVFKYSPSARLHIASYLTGIFFYIAAPLSLCSNYSMEVLKNVVNLLSEFVVNGKDRMQVSEFDLWGHVHPLLQLKWYAWIGAAFFFWGWIHQRRCHAILATVLMAFFKSKSGVFKADDYAIPEGDWFDYVSAPHYLAEIVIYGGLVIASHGVVGFWFCGGKSLVFCWRNS